MTASILPSSRPKSARSLPSGAAYSPGEQADVGGGAGEPLALGDVESREDGDRRDVVRSDHQRQRYSPDAASRTGVDLLVISSKRSSM